MAVEKNSAVTPSGDLPRDRDRLFAVPILKHICVANNFPFLKTLTTQERRAFAASLPTSPTNEVEAGACQLLLVALSEIEAWECIERVRKAVRHG